MSTPIRHLEASEPPSYVVGQDALGHWLAVETHGLGGGVFVTRDAALHYARDETCRRPGAVTVIDESDAAASPSMAMLPSSVFAAAPILVSPMAGKEPLLKTHPLLPI